MYFLDRATNGSAAHAIVRNVQISRLRQLFGAVALMCSLLPGVAVAEPPTAVLAPSRTSGAAPLYVFFDATASACPADVCERAFDQLHYRWSFGAYGPVAAHVFGAGRHVVELDVTAANGETARRSVVIDVAEPNVVWAGARTTCYSTSGDFTGCPAGAVQTVAATLDAIDATCRNDRRCLLRRGETFRGGDLDIGGPGPGMLAAFGPDAGPPPLLISTAATVIDWRDNTRDWRVLDVTLQGNGTGGSLVASDDDVRDILLQRIANTPQSSNSGVLMGLEVLEVTNNPIHDGIGVFDSRLHDFGFGSGGNAIYVAARRLAIVGNEISDTTSGEHVMRLQHYDGLVVSRNRLADQANAKAIITLRSAAQNEVCSAACGEPSRNAVISDNTIANRSTNAVGVCGVNQPQNGEIARCDNTLIERNHFSISPNAPVGTTSVPQYHCCSGGGGQHSEPNVVLRNNVLDITGPMYGGHLGAREGTRAYGNTCHTDTVTSGLVRCTRRFGEQHNNLLFAPRATGQREVASDFTTASHNVLATSDPFVAPPLDLRLRPGAVPVGAALFNPLDQSGAPRPIAPRIGALNEAGAPTAPGRPTLERIDR